MISKKTTKPSFKHIEVKSESAHKLKVLSATLGIHQRVLASAILESVLGNDGDAKAAKEKLIEKLRGSRQ